MDNKHYQIYIDSILALAQSIVLKSEYTAQRINDKLFIKYGEGTYDASDRTTWKYYLNLAGEYHSTDAAIKVRSFDTLEEIDFTKRNLEYHLATKAEYEIGGDRYNELVERNPGQEDLIKGVLNPVPIETAIAADEFKILTYRTDLVEINETSLIYNLQENINGMVGRYFNQQFNRTDDLYYASFIASLYMNMIPAIGTHRNRMSKTSEAHSHHQFQFISSYSGLAPGYNQLSLDQRLYFMRNADYLMHHAGTRHVFDIVKKKLIDDIGLPIGKLQINHDTSVMPAEVRPKISFKKIPLNDTPTGELTDTLTAAIVLDTVNTLATGNETTRSHYDEVFNKRAVNSLSSSVTTKVLDSSFVEDEGGESIPLEDTVIQHWALLAHYDYIKTVHEFVAPVSGVKFTLSAKDAYIFYLYSYFRYIGMTVATVPITRATRVQRIPAMSYSNVMSLLDPDHGLSEDWISEMITAMPYPAEFYSTESFKSYCDAVHRAANDQLDKVALVDGMLERGNAGVVSESLWMTVDFNLGDTYQMVGGRITKVSSATGSTFDEWFRLKGVAVERMVDDDFNTIWSLIMGEVTGQQTGTSESRKSIQAAMTRLLASFSSYSSRIVINNRTSRKMHAGPIAQRYAIKRVSVGANMRVRTDDIGVRSIHGGFTTKIFDNISPDVGGVGISVYNAQSGIVEVAADPSVDVLSVKQGMITAAKYPLNPNAPLSVQTYIDR